MLIKNGQIRLLGFLTAIMLVFCIQFVFPGQISGKQTIESTVIVAAAASLQDVLKKINLLYTQANPHRRIHFNFAASGVLQQQIEQGAPFDIFISAADRQMNALQKKGLLRLETRRILLKNHLVLIAPKQSSLSLTRFQQLIKPEVKRIAIGEPRTVPAGQYATELLRNLGILAQVKSKLVLSNNVRAVLTAVETGNVDAGFVYYTDARGSKNVTMVATASDQLHSPIHYPIAVLKSSQFPVESKQYIQFLQSKPAKNIFKKYGFKVD